MQLHTSRASGTAPWIVRPHGDLAAVDDGLWTVTGLMHLPVGNLPRRMTAVRLSGGRQLIFSAIALEDPLMAHLEENGDPAFLVVPNDHHRADALAWKQRYPEAIVVAPAGCAERVATQVPVDTSEAQLDDASVRIVTVPGTHASEFALLVRRAGGTTLIVNDIIANIRSTHGFGGWLLKRMGFAGDHPSVPGPIKALLIKEKDALKQQLRDWAAMPDLRRVIVSHGDVISSDARGALRALAASLD